MKRLPTLLLAAMLCIGLSACRGAETPAAPASQDAALVDFYFNVLTELYESDEGLNSEIDTLAFDLTEANNLSEADKAALVERMGEQYGFATVCGTFEELCEQGYIDREKLYFPDGLLFRIDEVEVKGKNRFTFGMSKWRSGLGAIGADDCKATGKNGVWSYTAGAMWIS